KFLGYAVSRTSASSSVIPNNAAASRTDPIAVIGCSDPLSTSGYIVLIRSRKLSPVGFIGKSVFLYPSLYHCSRILSVEGKNVLAVIVPGSAARPHFAGQSYIRTGSKSVAASETQFNDLIAQRLSIPYEILKWKGKKVTLSRPQRFTGSIITYYTQDKVVIDC